MTEWTRGKISSYYKDIGKGFIQEVGTENHYAFEHEYINGHDPEPGQLIDFVVPEFGQHITKFYIVDEDLPEYDMSTDYERGFVRHMMETVVCFAVERLGFELNRVFFNFDKENNLLVFVKGKPIAKELKQELERTMKPATYKMFKIYGF